MKAKCAACCLAVLTSMSLTGCDDDSFSYFFASDPGVIFIVLGNPVSMKPTNGGAAPATPPTGQSQLTNAQPAEAAAEAHADNSVRHLAYSSDLPFDPMESPAGAQEQDEDARPASRPQNDLSAALVEARDGAAGESN